jgi:hypothetical protein
MPKKICPKCGSRLHLSCQDDSSRINGLQIFKYDVEPALGARIDAMFEDLSHPLMVHLQESCARFRPLMYRIRILGKDEASAKPWLVILCPAGAVKHVESFFEKPFARQFCTQIDIPGGLEVAYIGRLNFRSGSWDDMDVALATTENQFGLPGSITVSTTHVSNACHATMGGMLVARDLQGLPILFGLTAGHLLHHEDTTDTHTLGIDLDAFLRSPSESDIAINGSVGSLMGRLAKVSFSDQARNLDWAFIEFLKGTSASEFLLSQSAYAIYEKFDLGNCRGAVTFRPDLPLAIGAKISNLPARVVTPLGTSFIKVFPITTLPDSKCILKLNDAANSRIVEFELQEGSSGTWVVSEEMVFEPDDTGNNIATRVVYVHGILVADDGYGDAYMIPLADILGDIQNVLGVSSVSLPHDTNEVVRLLQMESFSLHDNAPLLHRQLQ